MEKKKANSITVLLKTGKDEQEIKINKDERKGNTNFGMYNENENEKEKEEGEELNSNKVDIGLKFSSNIPVNLPLFRISFNTAQKKCYYKPLINTAKIIIQIKINPGSRWVINKNEKYLVGDMVIKLEPSGKEIVVTRLVTNRHREALSKVFKSTDGIITIGRNKNCNFPLESTLMSRVHASVYFNDLTNNWELKDGEMSKPSANGCYVFTTNSVEIHDKLEVKVNQDTVYFTID